MSNGRAHRRRVANAKVRAALPADNTDRVVIFGSGYGTGGVTPITVDRTMFLVLVPPSGASDHLLDAFSARATASVSGRCPMCTGRRHVAGNHHTTTLEVRHDDDCLAIDANLVAAVKSEGLDWTPATLVTPPGGQT